MAEKKIEQPPQDQPVRKGKDLESEGREPGKTPGSAESGGKDSPVREGPGKTPGNAEG